MNNHIVVAILRNPYGFSEDEIREARLKAADILFESEKYKDLYRFYEVSDVHGLIKEQQAHILRLQQNVDQLQHTVRPGNLNISPLHHPTPRAG